jgi:sulfite exporter TauE/SafE
MDPTQILSAIGGCFHQITLSYGLPLSLLAAGLVGGVTHCATMCGPFVLAQGGAMHKLSDAALLPYHLGRMTTYVALAVLVHGVFNLVFVFSGAKALIAAPMLVLAGLLFLLSAFPAALRLFPWATRLPSIMPWRVVDKMMQALPRKDTAAGRYLMGILLGFMPCGLVVAALLASATATSTFQAAYSMAFFAVGTMPALILVGLGAWHVHGRYPRFSSSFAQGAKVVSALWLFLLAGFLVF